jgi:glycosyltransferase involved in cell wall biosynthesis
MINLQDRQKSYTAPLVSVVLTTKNEEKNIETCLVSVKEQTYRPIEIIIVDNNSTDRTKEIAGRYTHHVYNKGPERSAQRNYGMIDAANGLYVMFVDADMILAPQLVESCVQAMQTGKFAALHIPEIILGMSYFSKVRRFERSFYNGTVIDGARFFKKKVFVQVGGFDPSLSGPEDWDIDKKIKQIGSIGLLDMMLQDVSFWSLKSYIESHGIQTIYSNVIYHNEADFSLRKYLSKKSYYSNSFHNYIEKWGKNDPDIRRQFGLWYRYFGVFLENGKWKRLFSNPVMCMGMYFLKVCVGVVYLLKK